jgi:putative spermidine/putrescine transport system permease protein
MERVHRRVSAPALIPAQAGTHACQNLDHGKMDPGFHRDDDERAIPRDTPDTPSAKRRRRFLGPLVPYLEALPAGMVFVLFFALPMVLVVVVSFFGYETYKLLIPDFTFDNYREVFSESVTYRTYLITLKFCVIVWAITLVLGFFIAYFIAFQVQSRTWQMALLLLCSIPFWTSIVIRMIAWIPLLGRNGIVNRLLVGTHLAGGPQEWLLYSEFAVILGYVHLYTLTMIVPIFNSMARIDKRLIEAATDAGAGTWQTIWSVILPLSKPGIAIGSIFVIAMVMGDFVTVDVLGGGQVASVGKQIATQLSYLQFPPAAANAMVLLVAVVAMIALLVRVVDIRKEL